MCVSCSQIPDVRALAEVRELVEANGWVIADLPGKVCADGVFPSLAHTIGLTAFGHPELAISGRMPDQAATALNLLATQVVDGEVLRGGDCWQAAGLDLALVELDGGQGWLRWAELTHPGYPVRGLQAIWADGRGLFPWEQDYPDDLTQTLLLGDPASGSAA